MCSREETSCKTCALRKVLFFARPLCIRAVVSFPSLHRSFLSFSPCRPVFPVRCSLYNSALFLPRPARSLSVPNGGALPVPAAPTTRAAVYELRAVICVKRRIGGRVRLRAKERRRESRKEKEREGEREREREREREKPAWRGRGHDDAPSSSKGYRLNRN